MTISVTSEQVVKASPKIIYEAFTRSMLLHEWLCDFATVNPRPGGRMYLWWNGNFYSAGEYLELEENKSVKFTWQARFDPAASEITVSILPMEAGTLVRLVHSVPDGPEWEKRVDGFKSEWDSTLPNLASVLETGLDRRVYDRPMLGISLSDFNSEIAKSCNIPVSEGLRLEDAAESMGAYAAGLRKGDVIVEFNGKPITSDFGTLTIALSGTRGGDKVPVTYYRGSDKHTVTLELSRRPVPDVPFDAHELAVRAEENYKKVYQTLSEVISGASDTELLKNPSPGEWSAMQTLSHLVHTERNWLANMADAVAGYERLADDFGGNVTTHINATIKAYGSSGELINELKRLASEVVDFLDNLPPEFIEHKNAYINMGNVQLVGMVPHTYSHIEQIKAALESARKING